MADIIKPHMASRKPGEDAIQQKKQEKDDEFRYVKAVNDSKILWVLLFALFLLYMVFKSMFVAAGAALMIIIIVGLEIWIGVKTGGLGGEVKEMALAIIVALVIWYGAGFLLNTPSPLDAVVSCSMVPALERGDMLLLQGGEVSAPLVNMTGAEWDMVRQKGLPGQKCAVCRSETTDSACLIDGNGTVVMPDPLFSYGCSLCERRNAEGQASYIPCTTEITVKNRTFKFGTNRRDTIVYAPRPQDPFARSGEIVHRAQLKVGADGEEYIFTKGDNNNWLDVQIGNMPVVPDRVRGRVIVRMPYIGYFKLFISGLFELVQGKADSGFSLLGDHPECAESFTGTQAIKIDRG
ncbi:MAG: hypothetical protein Q7T16_02170 [Candidatus Burarchaeum sp.]|nr:hypothetical protein [Candidatus Burarchaeum sp.]MDO8339440.1 hypothetical protein [Candidatus Burarchaeum sp.]